MNEIQGGVDAWPWSRDASKDYQNDIVFLITATQFGWTLHFEFFQKVAGPNPIQRYAVNMQSVSLNPSVDRIDGLTAICTNYSPHINEISLAGSPHGNGGRNYSANITCTVPGIKKGDFFRVRSEPLGGGMPPINQNKDAKLQLRINGGALILDIPNGVGTAWVERQLIFS
jgi:hypothetical protein